MFYIEYVPGYWYIFGYLLLLLLTMMVWHELGHMIYFHKYIGKKVKLYINKGKIHTGQQSDYDDITDDQYSGVAGFGVLLGTMPMFVLWWITSLSIYLMIIPYLVGCRKDLMIVWKKLEEGR